MIRMYGPVVKWLSILLFVLFSIVIGVFGYKFLFPVTYQDLDKAGERIDCNLLLADSKEGKGFDTNGNWLEKIFSRDLYVYDREVMSNYRFKQCRSAIDMEHQKRCDKHLALIYEGKEPEVSPGKENLTETNFLSNFFLDSIHCKNLEAEYVRSVNDEYTIDGNALIVKAIAYGRHSFSMTPVETIEYDSIKYFRIGIVNGDHKSILQFGNPDLANEAYSDLYAFMSGDKG